MAAPDAREFTAQSDGVGISLDGRLVASGSDDTTVKLWEAATQDLVATLSGQAGSIPDLAFSPNSRLLASAHNDKLIKLWDVSTMGWSGNKWGASGKVKVEEWP